LQGDALVLGGELLEGLALVAGGEVGPGQVDVLELRADVREGGAQGGEVADVPVWEWVDG
jgi:hypothetical protein